MKLRKGCPSHSGEHICRCSLGHVGPHSCAYDGCNYTWENNTEAAEAYRAEKAKVKEARAAKEK